MDKADLIKALRNQSGEVRNLLAACDDSAFNRKPDGKWSIAEQTEHLRKSVTPVNLALSLPKITFYLFGRSSFSRPYEEITALYQKKLREGARASAAFVPPTGKVWDREELLAAFDRAHETFTQRLDTWTDKDLDTCRLPHPILGLLTMREMALFTLYHLSHHHRSMRELAG